VTAYSIQDDALKTGELDYVNGGINEIRICGGDTQKLSVA